MSEKSFSGNANVIENENFLCQRNFFRNFDCKKGVNMNLRLLTEKYAAVLLIVFLKKSISSPFGLTSPIRKRRR